MRRTTSAAFTSALSAPNGAEPCPGVPRTRSRRHITPFSATVIVTFWPAWVSMTSPPDSVMHVVRGDGVAFVVECPLGSPVAAGLLVGDGEVEQGALRTKP